MLYFAFFVVGLVSFLLGHRLASRETYRIFYSRFEDGYKLGIVEGEKRSRERVIAQAKKATSMSLPGPKKPRRPSEPSYLEKQRAETWPQNFVRRQVAGD